MPSAPKSTSPGPDEPAQASEDAAPRLKLPTLYEFFAPGGVLARSPLPYEFRKGQLEMAQAVERALTEGRQDHFTLKRREQKTNDKAVRSYCWIAKLQSSWYPLPPLATGAGG